MSRIMGLDVGDATIGVAVSDEMGWTAQAIKTIRRKSLAKDFEEISELIKDYDVSEIVIGLPKNMNGTIGEQGNKTLAFSKKIIERFLIPVRNWDERLTTVAADKSLLEANLSRQKRKKVINQIAAALILQGYLDSRL